MTGPDRSGTSEGADGARRPVRIARITTVEVPVSHLGRAIAWYERHLGLRVTWRGEHEAALAPPEPGAAAAPEAPQSAPEGAALNLFLVETDDDARLGFRNTRRGYLQSVVDFYTPDLADLHARLEGAGVDVNPLVPGARGFGFRDADGNSLGAHNAG